MSGKISKALAQPNGRRPKRTQMLLNNFCLVTVQRVDVARFWRVLRVVATGYVECGKEVPCSGKADDLSSRYEWTWKWLLRTRAGAVHGRGIETLSSLVGRLGDGEQRTKWGFW